MLDRAMSEVRRHHRPLSEGLALYMLIAQRRETTSLLLDRFTAGRIAGCLGTGIALGVLTNLAQGWLPGNWNQIANSGAVWSVGAFVAGALLADHRVRTAAAGGLAIEVGLVAGYYGFAEFGRDGMGMLSYVLLWLVMAVVAGPLFGVAGAWWRRGSSRRRMLGSAAVAGVFGAEAVYSAFALHYIPQACVCAALLVVLPLTLARGIRERLLTLAAAIAMALGAYVLVLQGLLGW